ncbi:MAG: caspase family protein [Rubrivivax sp.]|nr:caspase family protein [Rubrivivax sp.]
MRRLNPARASTPRPLPLARAIAAAFLVTGAPLLWPAHAAGALPTGLQVVSGQASVSTQAGQMTVKNTAGALLNWQSFSIGAGNAVWFEQASATSKVLNRVVGNDPSLILGRLGSNGQVWLLNPHGVLFGAGARVDVAGLVAGTLRLNDNDFLAGRLRLSAAAGDAGAVRNEGVLATSFGGQVVLVGAQVHNAGEITAPGGAVTLAAATSVELVDTGLPNLAVRVAKPAGEALNLGRLTADGGRVDVYGAIVNQQGWVQADTLRTDATGQVTLRATDTLTLGEASTTRAVGTAPGSAGGQVDLLGAQVALTGRAAVDVSGDAAGGRIRLGGGDQGQDRSVPNARALWFGAEATLRADATGEAGTGGRIVLWSDSATRAYGTLSARGGSRSGDGGFVETSGGWLDARPAQVDVSSRGGKAGQWLLDPNDITISDAGPDTNIAGGPNFTSTNDGSVLSTATIAAALNAGTSVTVSTAAGGSNLQAGDIVVVSANLLVNPTAAASLTLNAGRDILVQDSRIESGAQPLSLNLVAAGGGIGAIEFRDVSINTAGGNVVLRGANAVQVPLPGGGFSAFSVQTAIGYDPAQQAVASKLTAPRVGVNLLRARFNLGSGSFSALAQGLDEAVMLDGTDADNTIVFARNIALSGWGGNASGVLVAGHSDLAATERLEIVGRGTNANGVSVDDGARLTLAAPGNPAAVLSLDGIGSELGVSIVDTSLLVPGSRGTPITATGGTVSISGVALGANPGIGSWSGGVLGDSLPAAASIDVAGATSLTLTGTAGSGDAIGLARISVLAPDNGSTLLQATGGPIFTEQLNLVAGGTATFRAPFTDLSFSNLLAGANPLSLAFETSGADSRGVYLQNSTVQTGGGDVRFGAVQNLNSVALGNTTVAAPWLVATTSDANYSGNSIQAALWLEGSTVDAGAGRIHGGGAATATAVDFMAGVTLDTSVLNAREITLAGRSESESGVNVYQSSLTATRVMSLDALASTAGWLGMSISQGNRLRLLDPTASAGSGLTLTAVHTTTGAGLEVSGGDVGSAQETTITVDGGFLHLNGSIANPTNVAGATGMILSGTAAQPGGLLFNATGATEVTVNATNGGTNGLALQARYLNFLGPQASAASTFSIAARGGRTAGQAPTQLLNSSFSSAGALTLLTDGLSVSGSRLVGDNGLSLLTDTSSGSARAGAGVLVTGSELVTATAGAVLRIGGSGGDAVRGTDALNAGTGITLTASTLKSSGSLVLQGRGADAGGHGIDFSGSTLQADSATLSGTARVSGHGVVADGNGGAGATQIRLRNLDITGLSADDPQNPSHAGVWLGQGVGLTASGRGNISLQGDSAVLGSIVGDFTALGDAAGFTVSTTGSQRLFGATLDFTGGLGTAVTLRADSGALGSGRLRIEASRILTGGGGLVASGSGETLLDAQGQPLPQNTLVRNGGSGLAFLGNNTLDAGVAGISLSGQASATGGWGVLVDTGLTRVSGGPVTLAADGLGAGTGLDVGRSAPAARLDIASSSLSVNGRGGTDPSTGLPLPAVVVESTSTWLATAGDLSVDATGALSLTGASLSASGALSLTAVNADGIGIRLLDGVTLSGSTVSLQGTSANNQGVGFFAPDTPGTVSATADLSIIGRSTAGFAGVDLGSGFLFTAPQALVDSDVALVMPAGSASSFNVSGSLELLLRAPGGATVGSRGHIDADVLGLTVAGLPDTATLRLRTLGGPLTLAGTLDLAPRLHLASDTAVTLAAGSTLRSAGAGDALRIAAPVLTADATATLAAPNGRWVLLLDDPRTSALGALAPDFSAYGLGALPWASDAAGNLLTPAAGNALGWALPVADLAGALTATLAPKVYDAGTAVNANPATWVVAGLLAGDTLALVGDATGNTADKNVGPARPVVFGGGTSFVVTDANGRPVFGYAAPSFAVDVTPAVATLVGTQVADKVYDATTGATLASLGTAQVLPGDVVGVGGVVVASFVDKNVGVGKAVTVNGLALTGADAANYTLQAPGGFTAAITPLALPVTGLVAQSKVYDATTAAPLGGAAGISPLAGDAVALAGVASGSFADRNAGTGKPVSVSGLALAGADAGNYTLQLPAGLAADITPLALTVAGLVAQNRVYDGSTVAPLAGAATIAPLAGDTVALLGTASGSFADRNAGTGKAVTVGGLALGGADAANYRLVLPATLSADVTPAPLLLQGVTAAAKVYDGGTAASLAGTLGGVVAGDTVTLTLAGQFADANAGPARTVNYNAALGGADAANYALAVANGSVLAAINPATLTYLATPASGIAGQALPSLSGTLGGFVAGETQASATTGALVWTTTATASSPAGVYGISGGGLAALNYLFVQAPGNASALTLNSPATSDPVTTATTVVTTSALLSVQVPMAMSTPTQGRVLDVTPALSSNAVAASAGRSSESSGGGAAALPGATGPAAGAQPGSATANPATGAAATASAAPGSGSNPSAVLGETLAALTASTASGSGGVSFDALDWSRLSRDEVQTLLAARARYKQQVFSRGVFRLQQDPTLADVRACRTEAELQTGDCVITEQLKTAIQAERARLAAAAQARPADGRRRVRTAALPAIERKLAVLIGVNDYRDSAVPALKGAIPDARAVRDLLEGRLGYETTVLENPSREAMVRALNKVALDAGPNDSVIVYYAGHGVLVPVDGVETGYWLPSDVDSGEPRTWLANADIARLIAAIGARQVMLVSDSCYSGTLAGRERVQVSAAGDAEDMLKRRAAVVMSSGGEEPVADEGRNGHSVFAWHFMQALQGLDNWQVGGSLYERVRTAVQRDFPQTPQYGASRSAGHQGNTDYLFERREFDTPAKP